MKIVITCPFLKTLFNQIKSFVWRSDRSCVRGSKRLSRKRPSGLLCLAHIVESSNDLYPWVSAEIGFLILRCPLRRLYPSVFVEVFSFDSGSPYSLVVVQESKDILLVSTSVTSLCRHLVRFDNFSPVSTDRGPRNF